MTTATLFYMTVQWPLHESLQYPSLSFSENGHFCSCNQLLSNWERRAVAFIIINHYLITEEGNVAIYERLHKRMFFFFKFIKKVISWHL